MAPLGVNPALFSRIMYLPTISATSTSTVSDRCWLHSTAVERRF